MVHRKTRRSKNKLSLNGYHVMPRIGSWEYDLGKKKIYWSDEVYLLYERDPELGPPSPEEDAAYYSPEQYKALMDYVSYSFETGKSISYNLQVRLPSRKPAFYHATIHPVRNERGDVIKLYGTVQDITEARKIEESLKESEELHRAVLSNISDAIFITDRKGAFTYICPNVSVIFRYTLEEVEKAGNISFLLGEDLFEIRKLDKEGEIRDIESTITDGSGEKHDLIIMVKSVDIKGGKILYTCSDITTLKQTEEALRDGEQKYRLLVEVTSDFIWEVDKDGVYTYISPKIFDILGYQPEEIIGKTPYVLMPPEEARRIKRIFQKLVSQKKPINSLVNVCLHKDGRLIIIETSGVPFYDSKGNVEGYRGIDRDITGRKKAEEALAEARDELEIRVRERTAELAQSEEKYRNVVDNATELIVVVQDRVIEFLNNKVKELSGYTKSELLSKSYIDFIHPEDRPMIIEMSEKRSRGESVPSSYEFRFIHKEGREIWVQINAVLIQWQGKPATLALISDIDHRKNMENQLKNYVQRITRVQEEERKRIADELHDDTAQYLALLRMQLNVLLQSGAIQDPEDISKLQYLEKNAGRALQDVRRYSHELRPVVLEIGLTAAIDQIVEDYRKLGEFPINMEVVGSEPELSEEVKLGFFRIAQEALTNIRKHSKATRAAIRINFDANQIEMSVSDNGIGFNVEEAIVLSNRRGSLGFTSMKERADLIGARLKIESKPFEGTNITVMMRL